MRYLAALRMKPTARLTGFLTAGAVTCLFLLTFYHSLLRNPNTVLMDRSPDGFKNYYTPWYHVKHDSSYTWFQGMNYPWGEHVTYTDCQPLVSNALRFVSRNIVDVSNYTVGILNLLMVFSILPAALLLCAILMRLGAQPLFAGAAGAGIALLAPQLMRFYGHYALAYVFVVPLVWWLHLKYFDKRGPLGSLLICLTVFLTGWIHPYFLSITAIFLLALWGVRLLTDVRHSGWKFIFTHGFVQALLPVILFQLAISLTDPVDDRPGSPYGIMEYKSSLWNLVLPYGLRFFENTIRIPAQIPSWEGASYVSVTGVLVLLFMLFRFGRRILPRKFSLPNPKEWIRPAFRRRLRRIFFFSLDRRVSISVLAALIVFALACYFPFSIKPSVLTELFPPIRQFRSLGRFAWVFYFVWVTFAFYAVWILSRRMKQKGKRRFALAMQWTPVLLLLTEAGLYNSSRTLGIDPVRPPLFADEKNELPENEWMNHIQPKKYSALLFLPYYHVGSENYGGSVAEVVGPSYKASLYTGLPLMNVNMSRTSLSQSWISLQAMLPPYRPLEIAALMKDPRPVLIVKRKESGKYAGLAILPFAEPIYENEAVTVYEMERESWAAAGQPLRMHELEQFNIPDTLYTFGDKLATKRDPDLFLNDYEDSTKGIGFHGTAAYTFNRQHAKKLYKAFMEQSGKGKILISLWVKMREDRTPTTLFGVEERTPTDSVVGWDFPDFYHFTEAMQGDWALCEREYAPQRKEDTVIVTVVRWNAPRHQIIVDGLLVRQEGTHLLGRSGNFFYYDNRYYRVSVPKMIDKLLEGKVIVQWK